MMTDQQIDTFENASVLRKAVSWLSRLMISRLFKIFLVVASISSCVATYLALTRWSTDIDIVYLLLNLDLILLLLLGAVIARQVTGIWSRRNMSVAGSRLHVRFVFVFSVLAAVPAIMMAVFSSIFLYFGVQAWFNDRVSTTVNESLAVAQAYLKEHKQVMRADVLAMANDLNRSAAELNSSRALFHQVMQAQSAVRNLPEAIVFQSDGDVLARSRLSFTLEFDRFSEKDMELARAGEVVTITADGGDRIRALVKLDRFIDAYLYVGRIVDAQVLAHVQKTEETVREYTTLEGRQSQLQISITAMFMAVTLLLLLAAVWIGLIFSQQLVRPIGELITAAEKVRAGDLSARVSDRAQDDELALLGSAFNRMTTQLQRQQEELITANRLIDERRRFTEAVLSGASSGIIGLDHRGVITLSNSVAETLLLGAANDTVVGRKLTDFIPQIVENETKSLELEYSAVSGGPRRTLLVRVTDEQGGEGAVATIDDISALASAQRKAAWADVVRRIAHEIKTPLTPIQLSAERLKRKYLPQISDDPETFEKCTDTIIRQVNDIGHLVGEFSAYARMPLPVKKVEDIVAICQDALVLQRQAHPDIGFGFIAAEPVIEGNCDRSQLTQVITNLLQNAIDSIRERQQSQQGDGRIKIVIEKREENISVAIEDNGLGLPEKVKDQLLEPYVTTKKKGSGLGLAIVKKIMEDHSGHIHIENCYEQDVKTGAKAVIVFPGDNA